MTTSRSLDTAGKFWSGCCSSCAGGGGAALALSNSWPKVSGEASSFTSPTSELGTCHASASAAAWLPAAAAELEQAPPPPPSLESIIAGGSVGRWRETHAQKSTRRKQEQIVCSVRVDPKTTPFWAHLCLSSPNKRSLSAVFVGKKGIATAVSTDSASSTHMKRKEREMGGRAFRALLSL